MAFWPNETCLAFGSFPWGVCVCEYALLNLFCTFVRESLLGLGMCFLWKKRSETCHTLFFCCYPFICWESNMITFVSSQIDYWFCIEMMYCWLMNVDLYWVYIYTFKFQQLYLDLAVSPHFMTFHVLLLILGWTQMGRFVAIAENQPPYVMSHDIL